MDSTFKLLVSKHNEYARYAAFNDNWDYFFVSYILYRIIKQASNQSGYVLRVIRKSVPSDFDTIEASYNHIEIFTEKGGN